MFTIPITQLDAYLLKYRDDDTIIVKHENDLVYITERTQCVEFGKASRFKHTDKANVTHIPVMWIPTFQTPNIGDIITFLIKCNITFYRIHPQIQITNIPDKSQREWLKKEIYSHFNVKILVDEYDFYPTTPY